MSLVARYASVGRKGKINEVYLLADGSYRCDCGYAEFHGGEECKHIADYRADPIPVRPAIRPRRKTG